MTFEEITAIQSEYAYGLKLREERDKLSFHSLGKKFGVSHQLIFWIVNRGDSPYRPWRHSKNKLISPIVRRLRAKAVRMDKEIEQYTQVAIARRYKISSSTVAFYTSRMAEDDVDPHTPSAEDRDL